jgi:GntR family transcriptional regulator/MocR family aminotransferase
MLRPWELNVSIDRASGTAIHVQIAQQIISDIHNGRFISGIALPGSRDLAKKIKVNRKTVIQAYDELIAQGWLISENKRGTFVSPKAESAQLALNSKSSSLSLVPKTPVSVQLSNRATHESIHFDEGSTDNRLLPFEAIARAIRHALIFMARHQTPIQSDAKGDANLRLAIAQMLNHERGMHVKLEQISLVASTQKALFAIAKTLIHNNEFVVFEQLSNPMARQAFANCGANILNISHDNQGIDIASLELLCVQYKVRAVYLSPQQQIPTTFCMSAKRRQALLALSERYQFLIIEDDDCHEFNFSNQPSLPMASQVKSNNTLYLGSLSGLLGHALNLSFIVAQAEYVDECAAQIKLMDGQADQVSQMAMTELLKNGEIKRHLARSLKIYAERRSHVANLLQAELAEFVSFRLPEFGLAIWLELSPSINMLRLQADAELEKVSFTAANYYSTSEHQVSAIRLGYAHLNEEDISLGIKRLKVAFINQQGQLLRA